MRLPALLATLLCACAGAESPPPTAAARAQRPAPAASAPVQAPDRSLGRTVVRAAILQRVELDEHPVMVGGRFHGFRITALRDASFWNGVDLKPGDVVTSVNGFPIERPEQAQAAFESLEVASELHVAYDRDGHPMEIVYAIADDR
jgi:type II secretory pathway component PulC